METCVGVSGSHCDYGNDVVVAVVAVSRLSVPLEINCPVVGREEQLLVSFGLGIHCVGIHRVVNFSPRCFLRLLSVQIRYCGTIGEVPLINRAVSSCSRGDSRNACASSWTSSSGREGSNGRGVKLMK